MLFDDRISVFLDDAIWDADLREVIRQDLFRKSGLLLVEVYRNDLELDRCTPPNVQKQVEKGVTVLAAGQADHYPVAFLDHGKVGYGLAHLLEQTGLSFGFYEQFFVLPRKIIDSDMQNNV